MILQGECIKKVFSRIENNNCEDCNNERQTFFISIHNHLFVDLSFFPGSHLVFQNHFKFFFFRFAFCRLISISYSFYISVFFFLVFFSFSFLVAIIFTIFIFHSFFFPLFFSILLFLSVIDNSFYSFLTSYCVSFFFLCFCFPLLSDDLTPNPHLFLSVSFLLYLYNCFPSFISFFSFFTLLLRCETLSFSSFFLLHFTAFSLSLSLLP